MSTKDTNSGRINGFLSYSSRDKASAHQVKDLLGTISVDCFMAHDDVAIAEDWKDQIKTALNECELFIPLLSKAFKSSDWGAQETGYIVARGESVNIVPISLDGTVPFGFIAHLQGRTVSLDDLAFGVLTEPIARKYPRRVLPRLIERVANANTFRSAEAAMRVLMPVLQLLTHSEADTLAEAAANNAQAWAAKDCYSEYLPRFLNVHGKHLDGTVLKRLKYQMTNQQWYREDGP